MTIHTTLHKLPVSLSQSQWSSIVDTRSGPSLLVPSPLDGVLYAEAGRPACIFVGNSDIVLFGKSLPISFVAAHHPGHRGVIPARGESFPP